MTDIDTNATQRLLDLPLDDNDAGAATVRDYLITLLRQLWNGGEDLIKRPFGNSGWQYEIYGPMVAAGLVNGTLDEDGYVDDADTRAADALMDAAIQALGGHKEGVPAQCTRELDVEPTGAPDEDVCLGEVDPDSGRCRTCGTSYGPPRS